MLAVVEEESVLVVEEEMVLVVVVEEEEEVLVLLGVPSRPGGLLPRRLRALRHQTGAVIVIWIESDDAERLLARVLPAGLESRGLPGSAPSPSPWPSSPVSLPSLPLALDPS